jgi:hypothetical protein
MPKTIYESALATRFRKEFEQLEFRNLICGPLKACVDAQQEAAMATYNYMRSVGFRDDPDNLADFIPTPISFYFVKDGVYNRLTVPLLSIIPIPCLTIGQIDLNFQAQLTADEHGKYTFKYASSPARIKMKDDVEVKQTSELQAKENLDIHLCARTSDMPAGMAKLMEILDTQMTDLYDVKEAAPQLQTSEPTETPVLEDTFRQTSGETIEDDTFRVASGETIEDDTFRVASGETIEDDFLLEGTETISEVKSAKSSQKTKKKESTKKSSTNKKKKGK